ncbi:glycoside hydrolase family 57 protein [Acidiplasma sp.]|uniref:glycoside hydrolase family 57 protein n=1 Tax=Acidiplasma sp. TaxID=1872114 RepID=UPI00258F2522|nr:glycoside hydrolase family 57 protein [Acidiplasma sp.]
MTDNVIMYFEVHQPRRLRPYRRYEIGNNNSFFWDSENERIFKRISEKSYIPATRILMENNINATFSLSGTFIEQAEVFYPEVLDVFKEYFKSGLGELLDETYYHSLAGIYDENEFKKQISMHAEKMKNVFGIKPKNFRNTELIYNTNIGRIVKNIGYNLILTEFTDRFNNANSPNFVYKDINGLGMLLRNYNLSDDISFRFSNRSWPEFPLTAEKYASWIKHSEGDVINIFMDYETFGEHQDSSTGIFEFLKSLKTEMIKNNINDLRVNDALKFSVKSVINTDSTISWADTGRDLSPWTGNSMQVEALNILLSKGDKIDEKLFGYLQTSDNFYYMAAGTGPDQEVHEYFNPYKSPYNAFFYFTNILENF